MSKIEDLISETIICAKRVNSIYPHFSGDSTIGKWKKEFVDELIDATDKWNESHNRLLYATKFFSKFKSLPEKIPFRIACYLYDPNKAVFGKEYPDNKDLNEVMSDYINKLESYPTWMYTVREEFYKTVGKLPIQLIILIAGFLLGWFVKK